MRNIADPPDRVSKGSSSISKALGGGWVRCAQPHYIRLCTSQMRRSEIGLNCDDIERVRQRPDHHARALKDRTGGGAKVGVNAGAKLHRFPEQNCINNADENGLEHGLFSWASGLGRIVGRRVGVVAA